MASDLDRSRASKDGLWILPFSTLLLSGPFCPSVKSLLPYGKGREGMAQIALRLTLASLESVEKDIPFPTSVYLI